MVETFLQETCFGTKDSILSNVAFLSHECFILWNLEQDKARRCFIVAQVGAQVSWITFARDSANGKVVILTRERFGLMLQNNVSTFEASYCLQNKCFSSRGL